MNFRIITKNHAADSKIRFLTKLILTLYGRTATVPNASELRLSLNLLKSIESGTDGFFVIIGAAGGFSAVNEALDHGLVSNIKVKNGSGGSNLKFIIG